MTKNEPIPQASKEVGFYDRLTLAVSDLEYCIEKLIDQVFCNRALIHRINADFRPTREDYAAACEAINWLEEKHGSLVDAATWTAVSNMGLFDKLLAEFRDDWRRC